MDEFREALRFAAQITLALSGGLMVLSAAVEAIKRLRGNESDPTTDVPVPKWFLVVSIGSFAVLGWVSFA